MEIVSLSTADLVLASVLLIGIGIFSLVLQLKIQGQLFIATLRMILQLTLVGLILKWVFAQASLFWTLMVVIIMVLFASREIWVRQERRLRELKNFLLGSAAIIIAPGIAMVLALLSSASPTPWYTPNFIIPILGMVLGNSMTAISLGMNYFNRAVIRERVAIEAQLSLGANRYQALRPVLRSSLHNGLIPTINQMAVAGIVSLPGMMTGQILAAVPPLEAVKYQILIMLLIGGSSSFGVLLAVYGLLFRITDTRHRLRIDKLPI